MRSTLIIVISASFASLATQAHAQNPVDILEQSIEVDMASWPPSIVTTARMNVLESTEGMYVLTSEFPGSSITMNGTPLATEIVDGTGGALSALMFPSGGIEAGEQIELVMTSSGVPTCTSAGQSVCAVRPDELVLLSGGPEYVFRGLYEPDPFLVETTVLAPAALEVAAGQGSPVSVETVGANRRWTFTSAHATEQSLIYARQVEQLERPGAVALLGVGNDTIVPNAELAVDTLSEIVPVLEELFGDSKVDQFRLLTGSDIYPFGAVGLVGNIFMPEVIMDPHFEYLMVQGMAHEASHTWWGGIASPSAANIGERTMLGEAFAEYSAWLALGELHGAAMRTSGVRMSAVWYMYGRPGDADEALLAAEPSSQIFIFLAYHKASVFLRTIEERVGRDAFLVALRDMLDDGPGKGTLTRFEEAVEAASGWSPAAATAQWLGATGFPTYAVETSIEGDDLVIDINAQGAFDVTLPIVLRSPDNQSVRHALEVSAGVSQHRVPAAAQVLVEVDPTWTMSRRIEPAVPGDVSLDGVVDGLDLIEVALRTGGSMPTERRVDGAYDPLYDVNDDRRVDAADLDAIVTTASATQP